MWVLSRQGWALSLSIAFALMAFLLTGCGNAPEAAFVPATTNTTTLTTTTATSVTTTSATTTTTTASTTSTTTATALKIVCYNLYWWNAFRDFPYKGKTVIANIKDTLQPDLLGTQECDGPAFIAEQTGLAEGSPFKGGQGIFIKNETFEVLERGFQDIKSQGRWGPRFVTWLKLTHRETQRTFWHFNTHWCVSPYCNSIKRWESAQNMLAIIQEKAANMPVIITGDLNGHISEPGMQHLLLNGYTLGSYQMPDFIYYTTAHFKDKGSGVGEMRGSDHKPVWVQLEFLEPSSNPSDIAV